MLARMIREAGGRPADEPTNLAEKIRELGAIGQRLERFLGAQSAQAEACGAAAAKTAQPAARDALQTMSQMHRENGSWLHKIVGS